MMLLKRQRRVVEASQGQRRRDILAVQPSSVHLLSNCHLFLVGDKLETTIIK